MNEFLEKTFGNRSSFTLTENGAKTLATTNSVLVDQFGKAGNYRDRELNEVFEDQASLWGENSELSIKFIFYLRMVTRKTKLSSQNTTDSIQNGQGSRDESFKRLLWVAKEHKDVFENNIWLLPIVGSWKDPWTLMFYDEKYNLNVIDKKYIFNVISQGLLSDVHCDLVKKFMPRIRCNSKCKTEWAAITNRLAKQFAKFCKLSYSDYTKLKTSGTAHDFQKILCSKDYASLNWNKIPGRALTNLLSGDFLERHSLTDEYEKWVIEQPTVKFTGYPFELAKKVRKKLNSNSYYFIGRYTKNKLPFAFKHTIDSQFMQLVEQVRKNGRVKENVLVALDTSGSMSRTVVGDTCCGDIATSLALFFAELNEGEFHHKIMMFDNKSYPFTLPSDSFCDNILSLPGVPCGGTNFQSVIDEIVKIRTENPQIPLEEFPTTLLVVSDMQFNPSASRLYQRQRDQECNIDRAKNELLEVFPKEFVDNFKFIWWDCASARDTYEGTANEEGITFFSGFDGSIISILLGEDATETCKPSAKLTAEEIVIKALSQEIFRYVKL